MLRRHTGFKPRTGDLGPRRQPLARQSPAAKRQQSAQRRAYAAAGDVEQDWCTACGKPGATDHCHLLTQKQYPQHRNDERNWIRACRRCHELFEHNKPAFAAAYPVVWAYIQTRIADIDQEALAAFRLKNPF